jgi:hypothetical protein
LVIPSFIILTDFDNPGEYPDGLVEPVLKTNYIGSNNNEITTRTTSRSSQDDAHGGEWLDSFEDDSEIDWAISDHLRIWDGDAEINIKTGKVLDAVALWHFNEGTGTTAYDATSNNNDGKLGGDGLGSDLPSWTNGIYGKGMDFDGKDDYIECGTDSSLDINNELTLLTWVKVRKFNVGRIISKSWYTDYTYMLHAGESGRWDMRFRIGSKILMSSLIKSNTWYHIAATYDGTTMAIYINGTLDKSVARSGAIPVKSTYPLCLGIDPNKRQEYCFNGTMDETIIFDKALTAEEIKNIFENSLMSPYKYGNLTSETISKPVDMRWDTLMIEKTQPTNTNLNITILNSSNNQPIPGSPTYTESGEVDISYIDPVHYPSIKLNATFEGNGSNTPTLHYWAVSWNRSNTWQDTLFGGEKVESSTDVKTVDGNVLLEYGGFDSSALGIWHFDEGSGTIAYDETDNNNDGTLKNGISWTTGKYGKALSFDGVDDYVDTPLLQSGVTQYTIEAWINTTSSRGIIAQDRGSTGTGKTILLFWGPAGGVGIPDGRLVGGFDTNMVWYGRYSSQRIDDGKWHHVAVVWSGSSGQTVTPQQFTLYIDGKVPTMSISDNSGSRPKAPLTGLEGTKIGYHQRWNKYANGVLDEVKIYGRALTAQEIKDSYLNGSFIYKSHGTIISEPIPIPNNMYWDTLIINKTEPANTYLNISVLDAISTEPIPNYTDLTGSTIDLSSLDPRTYPALKLQGTFESKGITTPILHDWSVNWTENIAPRLLDVEIPASVFRTNSAKICINLSDLEDSEKNLTLVIKYRSPSGVSWETNCLTDPYYANEHWICTFTPPKDAVLGDYSFMITVNDSYQYLNITTHHDLIEVLNNIPTTPDVYISPILPRTDDVIKVTAENSTDIETLDTQIRYWYRWYKNDSYLSDFDNDTLIHNSNTLKSETWQCLVYPFDGDGLGLPGDAEVTIQNSPPMLVEGFTYFEMYEDSSVSFDDKLMTMFSDPDHDSLVFTSTGSNNIKVGIIPENGTITFTPISDWFGRETITFYANDTESKAATETVGVEVKPVNDLPRIVQVGNQFVKEDKSELGFSVLQDDWLNLSIVVEDIDGDVERGLILYLVNITQNNNLYLSISDKQLIFHPGNADIGKHFLNISITDNNETPIVYISQNICIDVININDPPSVSILSPTFGKEFLETEDINFTCQVDDPDLLLPNSIERFTYLWTSNLTGLDAIGVNEQFIISNRTLRPGYYNITVMVKDRAGKTAFDNVEIVIKEIPIKPQKEKTDTSVSGNLIWLWILILVVIIVMVLVFFIFAQRKKRRHEYVTAPQEEVLSPDAAYKPDVSLVALPQTSEPSGLLVVPQPQTAQIQPPQQMPQPVLAPTHLGVGVPAQYQPVEPSMVEPTAQIPAAPTGLPTMGPPPQLPPATGQITPIEQSITPQPQQVITQEPLVEVQPAPGPVQPTVSTSPSDLPPDAYTRTTKTNVRKTSTK